nr:hypothetical protein GCM10020092_101900 [Actinoplanes digitatis]
MVTPVNTSVEVEHYPRVATVWMGKMSHPVSQPDSIGGDEKYLIIAGGDRRREPGAARRDDAEP